MLRALSKHRNTLIIALSCVLFYAAQASAQMHSIDHVFHQADESCALYHSLEHQKLAVIDGTVHVPVINCFSAVTAEHYRTPFIAPTKTWFSRAPPAYFPV